MKMLGNDIVTQEEFDTFLNEKLYPLEKTVSNQYSDLNNQVEEKISFLKKLIIANIAFTIFLFTISIFL